MEARKNYTAQRGAQFTYSYFRPCWSHFVLGPCRFELPMSFLIESKLSLAVLLIKKYHWWLPCNIVHTGSNHNILARGALPQHLHEKDT